MYIKPTIEDEIIEISDVIATSTSIIVEEEGKNSDNIFDIGAFLK